jgi:hypothetical protein
MTRAQTNLRVPSFYERKRLKAQKALEPVVFTPVRRNPLVAQTKIKMLSTVHGKFKDGNHFELIGGGDYWVDEPVADEYIVKGYATGKLSRNYSDDEQAQIRANVQAISMNSEVLQHG